MVSQGGGAKLPSPYCLPSLGTTDLNIPEQFNFNINFLFGDFRLNSILEVLDSFYFYF